MTELGFQPGALARGDQRRFTGLGPEGKVLDDEGEMGVFSLLLDATIMWYYGPLYPHLCPSMPLL